MTRTLRDICEQDYFPESERICSEKTRYQYRLALDDFGRHLGREPTIEDLTDRTVKIWMRQMIESGRPASVNTVRERVGRVLTLWTWLAKQTVGMKWPSVIKPEPPDTLPLALSEDQLRRLFASAAKERGQVCSIPADVWWPSYLAFVWNTSERKSAALAVQRDWFDFDRGVCTIPPTVRKGRKKWGVYQLWDETAELVKKRLAAGDPKRKLVWPWDKHDVSYYTAYNRIVRDAGIPSNRQTKTHSLRVSHATHLKMLGGDPTQQLMHSDPATTQKHYLDPRFFKDVGRRLFVPWQPPGAAT